MIIFPHSLMQLTAIPLTILLGIDITSHKCGSLDTKVNSKWLLSYLIKVSLSMPTTPEMSEASPSPRQATAGFFRFPFVGNASPRRFRGRAMSGIDNHKALTFIPQELFVIKFLISRK